MDRQNVIKGLNEIGAFITGRLEYGQAKNFLEFLDEAIAMLKEQDKEVKAAYRRGLESGRTIKWD